MGTREFEASREDRRLLGSFRNFSGRMKGRLEKISGEFGVAVTSNPTSKAPTIEQLSGASVYDISIGNEHLVTMSVIADEFCGNLFLQSMGPLYGDVQGFCTADDISFEVMMANLAFRLRSRTATAA